MKTAFIIRAMPGNMHAEEAAAKFARQLREQRHEDYPIILVPSGISLMVYEPGMLSSTADTSRCDCPECNPDE